MSEDEEKNYYEGWTLPQLANEMVAVRERLDQKKHEQAEIQKLYDLLRKKLVPETMENMGIQTVKLTGIGRLSLRAEAYASFAKDKKQEAMQWLVDNGHGDLIKEEVNSSTLKAFLKECMREGEEFPDDLFRFDPYMQATVTKT